MTRKLKPSKSCQGLLCLADINGFTRYLSSSTLKKSPERIAHLLNGITHSNVTGMEIAEIEGDCVFFYALKEKMPSPADLIEQVEKFYMDFQDNLSDLGRDVYENAVEEDARKRLGIKVIMHYGEFSIVEMAGRMKPMGETVLVAHRLLKNSLKLEEYVLMTEECVDAVFQGPLPLQDLLWSPVKPGEENYEHIGIVTYYSCDLKQLTKRSKIV
jgi:hypothetical protein